MNVPREAILDMLPLYLAGEVNPVTKAWIEEQLALDPKLAERAREMRSSLLGDDLPALPPELEMVALRRTRSTLAAMRWLFGLGIAFTAMPLSLRITLRPAFAVRPLILDYPAQLLSCAAVGAVCWFAYVRLKHSLSVRREERET